MRPFLSVEGLVGKTVAIAMSGGVDSSVAAALLLEQGYHVIGVTMRLWSGCSGAASSNPDVVAQAGHVAAQLNIPFHAFELREDFRHRVVDPFCREYLAGRTPNPCVVCNKYLKFGRLLELAGRLGADYLATGHYAAITRSGAYWQVQKAVDRNKDQSYFLFALNQQQLEKCLFPLGRLTKQAVRAIAAKQNLVVAEKSESQDICFIPDGDYAGFLQTQCRIDAAGGDIVHVSGRVLGRHPGAYHYTVGQRKGLGIGWTEPLYVVAIDAPKRQVIVGERQWLDRRDLTVAGCSWNIPTPMQAFACNCRIRYRHTEVPVMVEPLGSDRAEVTFADPQQGVTPGQAAVFYQQDRVIGGGWIE